MEYLVRYQGTLGNFESDVVESFGYVCVYHRDALWPILRHLRVRQESDHFIFRRLRQSHYSEENVLILEMFPYTVAYLKMVSCELYG